MSGHILYFGSDTCHRLPVFESAGYAVDVCASTAAVWAALEGGEVPDAVVLAEGERGLATDALQLTGALPAVPVVLFQETQRLYQESQFDLVVPILHPPEAWLREIAELIEGSRKLQMESAETRRKSQELRAEAAQVRAQSQQQRQRAAAQCANSDSSGQSAGNPKPRRNHPQ